MAQESDKLAVVLIHGVGEQRPMDTLRGFVDAVWTSDRSAHHPHSEPGVWSKPDRASASMELRRLTTSKSRSDARIDFFELYWAHEMQPASLVQVMRWMLMLLTRRMPPALVGARVLAVTLLLLGLCIAVNGAMPGGSRVVEVPWWWSSICVLGVWTLLRWVLQSVVGQAVRYLQPWPENIKTRREIRTLGVKLLRELHSRPYERIVLVGHSLGSVIGYDILTHAWAEVHDQCETDAGARPHALERAAAQQPFDREHYRDRQPAYAAHLREHGHPWRVTDFVTLGSPLTYADILVARSLDELAARQVDRELPSCPPQLEGTRFTFSKRRPRRGRVRVPHHAAVFAPVRWTNLYFKARWLAFGDVIGGPLSPLFGEGVEDVELRTSERIGLLSHTLYWSQHPPDAPHIEALRAALRLGEDYGVKTEQSATAPSSSVSAPPGR